MSEQFLGIFPSGLRGVNVVNAPESLQRQLPDITTGIMIGVSYQLIYNASFTVMLRVTGLFAQHR